MSRKQNPAYTTVSFYGLRVAARAVRILAAVRPDMRTAQKVYEDAMRVYLSAPEQVADLPDGIRGELVDAGVLPPSALTLRR